ncbi:hydantoinase/oxoprolinase family protein [Methylopila sp. M107]|uniref:hydantoinase/oxoprolinase family protein n=1 Tax=Methylopila sp. M107 TaxID=1101190 RepID=UPI000373EB9F|nr:hydantoinase/oxoprolinase family protein [Methylopila sp. M107]
MTRAILGWDVGGAHLKAARLGEDGRLEAARIAPCALWKGLDQLDAALDALAEPGCASAVTMTGELVDLFPDRAAGVAALVERLSTRLGGDTAFYAGGAGFLASDLVSAQWRDVASANWRATAEALALEGDGLLVDVGSTTSDIVPFLSGHVSALGATDAGRMACDELVYLGVARTPVMAIAPRVPFGGGWIAPMAEHFATSADVFRLTGELPDGADLHAAADGGPKTVEASARRLLRMVGVDLSEGSRADARALASWLSEAVLRRLADAVALVLSRDGAAGAPTIYGAGVGRFLAAAVARRLGLMYRDVGEVWSDDPALAAAAANAAPAVAVARLFAARQG